MGSPNASYSITLRLLLAADDSHAIGLVTTAIGQAGGTVAAVDFVDSAGDPITVDVTAKAADSDHANRIRGVVDAIETVEVHRDPVLLDARLAALDAGLAPVVHEVGSVGTGDVTALAEAGQDALSVYARGGWLTI